MDYTIELNNARSDSDFDNRSIKQSSPLFKTYDAMVNGKALDSVVSEICSEKNIGSEEAAKYVNKSVQRIKEKNSQAMSGDSAAASELNSLRKLEIAPALMQEIKLLSIFGTYQHLGFGETVEFEYYKHVGLEAVEQAEGVSVPFGGIKKVKKQLPTQIISGGYVVNYRQAALGDMTKENEGINQVKTMIRNKAVHYIVNKMIDAIENANGVKFLASGSPLTKTDTDKVLGSIRRFGRPTVIADYALLSKFNQWAGYVGKIDTNTILGISQNVMDELQRNGLLGMYNGTVLQEMPNPYDLTKFVKSGDETNFATLLPIEYGFVTPAGSQSPVHTFSRGDITSFVGNDVTHGDIITRFDLEVAAGIEEGNEYKIGLIHDHSLASI